MFPTTSNLISAVISALVYCRHFVLSTLHLLFSSLLFFKAFFEYNVIPDRIVELSCIKNLKTLTTVLEYHYNIVNCSSHVNKQYM